MNDLKIDSGAVRLTIDGDENRVIRFYPTDVSFIEGFYELAYTFDKKRIEIEAKEKEILSGPGEYNEKAMKAAKLRGDVFKTMREGIDRIFGAGTSQTVFGDHDNLSMAANFFVGVTPYIQAVRKREMERYTKDTGDVME